MASNVHAFKRADRFRARLCRDQAQFRNEIYEAHQRAPDDPEAARRWRLLCWALKHQGDASRAIVAAAELNGLAGQS